MQLIRQVTMITGDSRLRLGEDVVFQSFGDGSETVLVSLRTGFLFSCNDTTRAFLECIDGRKTLAEIGRELVSIFEVSEEKLLNDLRLLADKMVSEELISVENEKSD